MRKQREEPSGDSWMNTYSDLVTLLMTFFVLLFSMSSVNEEKWEAFVKALTNPGDATNQIVVIPDPEQGDAPLPNQNSGSTLDSSQSTGLDAPNEQLEEFSDLFFYLKQYVEEKGLDSQVEVMRDGDSVVYIRFQNNIFFDPDKYRLKTEAYEILNYIGDCLYTVHDDIRLISINGHTASVNYETSVSDWTLSGQRASSVAIFLDEQKHIDPKKIRAIGYGRYYPIAPNDTEENRIKNRRVDIVIVRNKDGSEGGWSEEDLAGLFDPEQFPRSGGAEDLLTPESASGSEATE